MRPYKSLMICMSELDKVTTILPLWGRERGAVVE